MSITYSIVGDDFIINLSPDRPFSLCHLFETNIVAGFDMLNRPTCLIIKDYRHNLGVRVSPDDKDITVPMISFHTKYCDDVNILSISLMSDEDHSLHIHNTEVVTGSHGLLLYVEYDHYGSIIGLDMHINHELASQGQ